MCVEKESDDEGTNRVPTHLGSLSKTIVQRKCCDRPQAKQGENLPHHLMFQKKREERRGEKKTSILRKGKIRRKNATTPQVRKGWEKIDRRYRRHPSVVLLVLRSVLGDHSRFRGCGGCLGLESLLLDLGLGLGHSAAEGLGVGVLGLGTKDDEQAPEDEREHQVRARDVHVALRAEHAHACLMIRHLVHLVSLHLWLLVSSSVCENEKQKCGFKKEERKRNKPKQMSRP